MNEQKQKKDWQVFEYKVKKGLEALGYEVQHDVLQVGSQVDLNAEMKQPLFTSRLIVECKDVQSIIGVETVRSFSGLVNTISKQNAFCSGLIVAKNGFTKEAKSFAIYSGINLLTLSDLYQLSFDPNPIIDSLIEQFECDDLGRTYIDLSCHVQEHGKGTIYKPVEKFLDDFLVKTKKTGVVILGNFGTGKTSLCRHYAYLMAKRWKEGNAFALPIYVNLREVDNFNELEEQVFRVTRNSGAGQNISGVKTWLENSPTLIFLDGFDEMAGKMDRLEISTNILSLKKFCEKYSVHILLTCRTHFFRTQIEEDALGDVLRLYMLDWGRDELLEYISRTKSENTTDVLKIIQNTYNLEELAKTPIFLNMIVNSVNEIGGKINQSKLYQIYTDKWIDEQKNRSKLKPEDKRQFMEELAYIMLKSGRTDITYAELPMLIGQYFRLQDNQILQSFDQDVRTCTFLVRDDQGGYHFVHKSYMEYFVAAHLALQVKQKQLDKFADVILTKEISTFFANFFENDADILMQLLFRIDNPIIRLNAASVIGNLPYNERLQDSLILALSMESDEKVVHSIVDSLLSFATSMSIRKVIETAKNNSFYRSYCIRQLANHIENNDVQGFFADILERENETESIVYILESISLNKKNQLSSSVHKFLEYVWWHNENKIIDAILDTVDSLENMQLARDIGNLAEKKLFSDKTSISGTIINNPHKAHYHAVVESLTKVFWPIVKEEAEKNRKKNMLYFQNEGQLHNQFGEYINEKDLKKFLNRIYKVA